MSDQLHQYMLFSISERQYAVEIESVAEIAELATICPIPFAPPFMRGVVNIHGKLAAVLDLSLFSGGGGASGGHSLLLLSWPETSLALIVDQIDRIISSEEIISRDAGCDPFEEARLTLAQGEVTLIALEALIEAIEGVLER